jgi:hypothetical protein
MWVMSPGNDFAGEGPAEIYRTDRQRQNFSWWLLEFSSYYMISRFLIFFSSDVSEEYTVSLFRVGAKQETNKKQASSKGERYKSNVDD